MKRVLLLIIVLSMTKNFSQELNLPVFTQYLADNPFVISPSFAGIGDNFRIRANGLTQWVGIKDAPNNQSIYADFRIADRSGVGLSLYNDSNGNTRQAGAKVSFAHHLILDYYSKQYLSFGISYNFNSFKIDINDFNQGIFDPAIVDNRSIANNNFDVSVLYRYRGFYSSINLSNILSKKIDDFKGIEPSLLRNYQVYAGYVFKNSSYNRTEFEPSAYFQLFESDGRSSTDINFKVRKYDNNENYYWAGLSYRFLNDQFLKPLNVGPMIGLKQSRFYFGYAYQLTLNELAQYNSGTHVVTLGFDLFQGISDCPCTQNPIND